MHISLNLVRETVMKPNFPVDQYQFFWFWFFEVLVQVPVSCSLLPFDRSAGWWCWTRPGTGRPSSAGPGGSAAAGPAARSAHAAAGSEPGPAPGPGRSEQNHELLPSAHELRSRAEGSVQSMFSWIWDFRKVFKIDKLPWTSWTLVWTLSCT